MSIVLAPGGKFLAIFGTAPGRSSYSARNTLENCSIWRSMAMAILPLYER
jgi:hypothetical protein